MRRTSANDILLYEHCPQKWAFAKSKKKELKQLHAFYRFSSALHDAVKKFAMGESIDDAFESYWGRYKTGYPLIYKPGETWESLSDLGQLLLVEFQKLFKLKGLEPVFMEQKFEVHMDSVIYLIQPDLICQAPSGELITVEHKTTEEPLFPIWVKASDQLTGQALAIHKEFDQALPMKVVICNFVKTGAVTWMGGTRNKYQLDEYKRKILYYSGLMDGRYHPRRSLYAFSSPCRWCDFGEECHSSGRSLEQFAQS